MSFEGSYRQTPSRKLAIVIREAIQLHADHFSGGAVNVEDALDALSGISAKLLSEIADDHERETQLTLFNAELTLALDDPATEAPPASTARH